MKKIENWLYLITPILLILIMIFICCLLIKNDSHFSTENIKDLLGIIISCVALIVTAFFVVMAVNAYGHIKEIEEIKHKAEEVNGLVTTVTTKASEVETSVETATNKAQEVNGLVATVTTKAHDVETSVETATSKAEEVNDLVATVTTKANEVEASVKTVTSKAKEVNDLVATVTTKANDVETSVKTATSKAKEVNGLVATVTTKAHDVESLVNTVTSKAKEANDLITKVTNSAKEVKEQVTDAEDMLNDLFSAMISFHEEKITQAQKNKKDKQQINKDLTNLTRLEVYKYSRFLKEDTMKTYLLDLANLGDASDIKPIEDISNNLKMSQNIRDIAREVVKDLRRRFSDA